MGFGVTSRYVALHHVTEEMEKSGEAGQASNSSAMISAISASVLWAAWSSLTRLTRAMASRGQRFKTPWFRPLPIFVGLGSKPILTHFHTVTLLIPPAASTTSSVQTYGVSGGPLGDIGPSVMRPLMPTQKELRTPEFSSFEPHEVISLHA